MPSELILVTGASGFLGCHILDLLLQRGFRVRATARGPRINLLKKGYSKYLGQLEVVEVADVATADLTVVLDGVTAVIHTAATLWGRDENDVIYKSAIDGSMNVITQSQQAGIRKIVFTSSIVTAAGTGSLTDKAWNPITKEQAEQAGPFEVYMVAKTLAERAVWDFADSHPDVDMTVLNPPYLFGPMATGHIIPEPDYAALSTNTEVALLLRPGGELNQLPGYIDVRDTARAHVAALTSPPVSAVGRKRIILSSPYGLDFKKAIEILAEKRPELKDRLADIAKASVLTADTIPVDHKRVKEVLGLDVDSYCTWDETILDTVDSLVALEKEWKSKGYPVEFPPPSSSYKYRQKASSMV